MATAFALPGTVASRRRPRAGTESFRFKAVRPTFDLHPFQVHGQLEADAKTVKLWAQDHEGWLSMLEALAEWASYPLYDAFDGAPPPARTGANVMLGLQNEREWLAFSTLSAAQVVERFEAAQIANARVNTMAEVWAHPQLGARGRWRTVDTPAGPIPALPRPGSWTDGDGPRMDAVPALGQLSMDVKLMMQTEVGEVQEPYYHGRGSSSTMPQKRNPISSAYVHGAISVLRQHAAALMDAMVADHERSTGPWQIEWIVLPEAFCLLAGALKQSRVIVEGLEVDAAAMQRMLDPANYLGQSGLMVDRVLARMG